MEISENIFINEYLSKEDHLLQTLLNQDSNLQAFINLPSDIQRRELKFISNSVMGIKGYLKRKTEFFYSLK